MTEYSPALASVIERLQRLSSTDSPALAGALTGSIGFDDVRRFVRFGVDSYVRNLVYRNDDLELRLLCWRPGQSTSLHGHGHASCAFRILRGAATEIVLGERDRLWAPGSIVAEHGPLVHQVCNTSDDALLTLHAYSPPLPIEQPSRFAGRQIVIVGGGFSGVATAYHLLRTAGPDLRIHVVEMGPWLGRGIAYGVESEVFRLNVPASRMSLDPDLPADFVEYAGAEADPTAFLGRARYGRYVANRLAGAIRGARAKLRVWRDEVVGLDAQGVELRGGMHLPADAIVLATGLTPRVHRNAWHPRVVDAWDECSLATLPRDGRILLLGAGLSALDVLALLDAQGFRGQVKLLSRRGLLPLSHEEPFSPVAAHDAALAAEAPRQLLPLIRWMRGHIEQSEREGLPWQRAVDRFRPHLARFYRALDPGDRARFVEHVRPYWDVIRHRAPADSLARVREWENAGRLTRACGTLTSVEPDDAGVSVAIAERDGGCSHDRVDAVVRCIGPALDVSEHETPLLRSMLDQGLARASASGLGLDIDAAGSLVDAAGRPSSRLFALGATRRASDWETTSVPDISVQARELARRLAG